MNETTMADGGRNFVDPAAAAAATAQKRLRWHHRRRAPDYDSDATTSPATARRRSIERRAGSLLTLLTLASIAGRALGAYQDGGGVDRSSGPSGLRRREDLLRRASKHRSRNLPVRPLAPPFPNGLCGGTVVEIPPEDTFGIDTSMSRSATGLFLPPRPVSVWLPPNYAADTHLRYPVLYCHDGQNAIDDASSWTGSSWRLAGALVRLAERNLLRPVGQGASPVPIVVLLPSAQGDMIPGVVRRRHMEYGDTSNPVARTHADFVAETVKPLIDSMFRTVPSPSATFSIGSSLGGQASYHLVLRHPDKFGGAAGLSPAFQPGTLASAASSLDALRDGKVLYMDNGGDVDESKVPLFDVLDHFTENHWWNPGYFWLDTQLQPGVDAMRMALDVGGVRYGYHREAGARHNERAWARRIDRPLAHLFGERAN
uniref:Esterase n=1 Tax=Odontella aurita TaxID=265563 RepID=A0A7S4MX03_9STRA|mmetsp:Transcript_37441/g.112265  ORF Transcript_37441/g.112265 Transcript_37441/m.112265 type:complete len:428 (+) Transcript_37441:248-1531(+)